MLLSWLLTTLQYNKSLDDDDDDDDDGDDERSRAAYELVSKFYNVFLQTSLKHLVIFMRQHFNWTLDWMISFN